MFQYYFYTFINFIVYKYKKLLKKITFITDIVDINYPNTYFYSYYYYLFLLSPLNIWKIDITSRFYIYYSSNKRTFETIIDNVSLLSIPKQLSNVENNIDTYKYFNFNKYIIEKINFKLYNEIYDLKNFLKNYIFINSFVNFNDIKVIFNKNYKHKCNNLDLQIYYYDREFEKIHKSLLIDETSDIQKLLKQIFC